ncbi:3-phosphoshikimate 1-carboxyvinyltransferase [Lentibacillus amyloliquefaciens]|uniref:3-phosphoshikimate 1-carboxyvinyltransferase n=1 Tax=Lentibacillus amyloliquefaciens TaxID=1472767 RepID=A0A0U4F597_9BACI|nr:3-phosphoshikimate 1-carboxyvinyltransferase [Lentibacillus amyloliquefaciens]ALX47955.1 3-phosphoshikimate 1-carboxyvinyltransferase [Lentibacillus amyloliquefaciens]
MNEVALKPTSSPLQGALEVPGDKSISHRAVMLGSLAKGKTSITNFLTGEDCSRTIDAFRQFGISIEQDGTTVTIESNGPEDFQEPSEPIYFGNSGTTARLMLGVLAGLPFFTAVYGDSSLVMRPMDRVTGPLKKMGAQLDGRSGGIYLPMAIRGGALKGINYTMPVKSAQVKSAVLLGGLFADGTTRVIEESATRNHSENMLRAFGADITETNGEIRITNKNALTGMNVHVPGDISSAAFFMTAAAIVPDSELTLKNVGLNHSRSGIIDVLKQMGASISISNVQTIGGERQGDVSVVYQKLTGTIIDGDIIPRLIDELPIIALAATQAEGTTVIRDARELRVKETDRIKATTDGLANLGANIEPTEDGMVITGGASLTGGKAEAYNDHRIAMMLAIASLVTNDDVTIDDISSINISYPGFFQDLQTVTNSA